MNNRRKQLMLASAKEYCKCVVEGKTIKYNQKTSTNNISNESYYGMSVNCSNGIVTITGTSTFTGGDSNIYTIFNDFVSVANHKYISLSSNKKFRLLVFNGVENFYSFGDEVFTPNFSDDLHVSLQPENTSYIANGLTLNETITCMVIDLTELGLDNVNSVADFYETDLGKYIAKGNYLPYEPNGKFIHAQSPINFKGVNIWNEQYQTGYYNRDTGIYVPNATYEICTKDKIRIKPNAKYYVYCGKGIYGNYAIFYDKNKNHLGYRYYETNSAISCIKSPQNAYYMTVNFGTGYGNVYLNDICISENLLIYDTIEDDKVLDWDNGSLSNESGSQVSRFIPVKTTNKKIACDMVLDQLCAYDKNKNAIGFYPSWDFQYHGQINENVEITLPINCEYIKVSRRFYYPFNESSIIYYVGYHKYCGNSVFESGLTLQKGDTYKSWGLDEISYNNLIPNANQDYVNSGTDSASANAIIYGANGGVYWAENLTSLDFYSGTFESNTTELVNIYMSGNNTNLYFATDIQMTSGHKYYISFNVLGNNASVVGGLRIANLRLIDLTELGLSALTDKLRIFLQKNYRLPYTTTNKTIKEQLSRTMVDIVLDDQTWTKHSATINRNGYYTCDVSSYGIKNYDSSQVANALSDKCSIISEEQSSLDGRPLDFLSIYENTISYNSNDNSTPTGHLLVELATPTLIMWQTLDIQDYNEFVEIDPHIFKLNRDLSDYGVLDVTSDTGTKQTNLTWLNIAGGDGDYCYQDGFIYQKTDDIESVWIYQIQISNAPSRMVSRRTINVESENGIDMDFTKE